MKREYIEKKIEGKFTYSIVKADTWSYVFIFIKKLNAENTKETVTVDLVNREDYEWFVKFKITFNDKLPNDFDSDWDGKDVIFGSDKDFDFYVAENK